MRARSAKSRGGQSATNVYSYVQYLYGVPVVVTANRTTAHLDYLTENDFLGNPSNRVVVRTLVDHPWQTHARADSRSTPHI